MVETGLAADILIALPCGYSRNCAVMTQGRRPPLRGSRQATSAGRRTGSSVPADKKAQLRTMARPSFLAKIVGWLRAGYPDGVPEHDYVPLVALLGSQLTDDEVRD